ncbi:glutamate--cysteine ligase [Legionella norrlandica]|uniref:Glutamate--cysteine ligase n=1 Tax=Legionella norrlandica TaxID=1498499 RepID=A0A0A2SST3_9GAMM|nr:glutamate-cysteine ligase family protein [Legionella norrlandica]KGP62484.1 glutamate--cysteine ligase [Legionella norrlandica]
MSDFPIFSVLGIEIEYMLVDKDNLNVQPKSDLILNALAGHQVNEIELDDIAISNELVLHVLELKNNGPKPLHSPVSAHFQKTIQAIQPLLTQHNLLLLPTGAHPWMDPHTETVRWPHGNHDIYNQFDMIFNCQGHGWANLQSMHVNLPYSNEEEFCQLHNTIRLLLPLLPALAASTPFLDGKPTGLLDSRLYFYSRNQQLIPSICGETIPEFIRTETEYQEKILNPMYQDISPYDPNGILQYQWLNSRAAIPKFDVKAIEIRILDSQECVEADIAIAKAINAILKYWQSASNIYLDKPCDTKILKQVFDQTIKNGLACRIDNKQLLEQWQLPAQEMSVNTIWSHLIEKISHELDRKQQQALELILRQGNLSERIIKASGLYADHNSLKQVYRQLTYCLLSNEQFIP